MSKIKTFRGLIADGSQETIHLKTITGTMGYRIRKFELQFRAPGTQSTESIVKIYKVAQTSVDGIINFSDNTLIAASFLSGSTSATYSEDITTIFDTEIFNQDIFVTHSEVAGVEPVNYFIELEQVKLEGTETTIATLQNIKNRS
jgi:hypothetical protein